MKTSNGTQKMNEHQRTVTKSCYLLNFLDTVMYKKFFLLVYVLSKTSVDKETEMIFSTY